MNVEMFVRALCKKPCGSYSKKGMGKAGACPVSYTHLDVYKRQVYPILDHPPDVLLLVYGPNIDHNVILMATVDEFLRYACKHGMNRVESVFKTVWNYIKTVRCV